MEAVNAAIIYYSATGTVHDLARAAAEGAEKAGAEVRLRKVAELAPQRGDRRQPRLGSSTSGRPPTSPRPRSTTSSGPTWCSSARPPGSAPRPASSRRSSRPPDRLWQQGKLADKVYTAFTAASTAHGGHEATLLALGHVFHHWGGIIVPPGYTDPIQFQTGNPYGTSHASGRRPPGRGGPGGGPLPGPPRRRHRRRAQGRPGRLTLGTLLVA